MASVRRWSGQVPGTPPLRNRWTTLPQKATSVMIIAGAVSAYPSWKTTQKPLL
jgi:hypothetical protein